MQSWFRIQSNHVCYSFNNEANLNLNEQSKTISKCSTTYKLNISHHLKFTISRYLTSSIELFISFMFLSLTSVLFYFSTWDCDYQSAD